jgi:chemotaxis protein CheX
MWAEIAPTELTQIVGSVFETMLKLEVSETREEWFPDSDRLTAVVHMSGHWSGAVLVECDRDEACRLAGRFLSIDPPDAVDDMVRDVMGEIANMIGGNLKCVLTPGITLSTPFVIDGSNSALPVCGAEIREPLTFACAEGAFWVTVLETSLK